MGKLWEAHHRAPVRVMWADVCKVSRTRTTNPQVLPLLPHPPLAFRSKLLQGPVCPPEFLPGMLHLPLPPHRAGCLGNRHPLSFPVWAMGKPWPLWWRPKSETNRTREESSSESHPWGEKDLFLDDSGEGSSWVHESHAASTLCTGALSYQVRSMTIPRSSRRQEAEPQWRPCSGSGQ